MTDFLARAKLRFDRLRGRKPGNRVLVHEILSIQILSAAIVGGLAIAALYWGGQWVLHDNYSRWALQWTEELNELGSPLYLSNDNEASIRLETFVQRYPEIKRVAYYNRRGEALFAVANNINDAALLDLPDRRLVEASQVIGSDTPYVLNANLADPRKFDILAPVWTEAIANDGLFDFDPNNSVEDATTRLVGFVGIHLDFFMFHDRLLANIRSAVVVLLFLLIGFALYGRRVLRNALRSISP